MKEKLLQAIHLILVGEILIAKGIFFELEKTFTKDSETEENSTLFSMLETFFLFEEKSEAGLFNLKNRYRDYLLNLV